MLGSGSAVGHAPGAEASLRRVLKEADMAAERLTDELRRRESSVSRMLRDVETAEERMKGLPSLAKQARPTSIHDSVVIEPVREERVAAIPPTQQPIINRKPQQSAPKKQRVNIYGELISDEIAPTQIAIEPEPLEAVPTPRPSMLRNQIEKYVEPVKPEARTQQPNHASSKKPIESLYDAAEKLLRSGQGLATVSAATKLPLEEVRMLSQVVMADENMHQSRDEERSRPTRDPRLGVLGTIRRETAVL